MSRKQKYAAASLAALAAILLAGRSLFPIGRRKGAQSADAERIKELQAADKDILAFGTAKKDDPATRPWPALCRYEKASRGHWRPLPSPRHRRRPRRHAGAFG